MIAGGTPPAHSHLESAQRWQLPDAANQTLVAIYVLHTQGPLSMPATPPEQQRSHPTRGW
jgi:hypothetical protein